MSFLNPVNGRIGGQIVRFPKLREWLAGEPGGSLLRGVGRRLGQLVAYGAVPLSIVQGDPLIPQDLFTLPMYVVAVVGLVAALRGATLPKAIAQVGAALALGYALLLAIEWINGDLSIYPRPLASHFPVTYFPMLAVPFFAMGLLTVGATYRGLEWAAMPTIVVATVFSLMQFLVLEVDRPGGFHDQNPITFTLVVAVWSVIVFSGAFRNERVNIPQLAIGLLGWIPILLGGSKLVWACAALAYLIVFVSWAGLQRWQAICIAAAVAVIAALALSQFDFVKTRVDSFFAELTRFVADGDTTGSSFGLRYSAAIGGLAAFADSPLFGYGLATVKAAALNHRPDYVTDFTQLWHLHNQYVTHLVAFGIFGLAFLLSLLSVIVIVARRAGDAAARRFGVAYAAMLALFMAAETLIPAPPSHGMIFYLLSFMMIAGPARSTVATPPLKPS